MSEPDPRAKLIAETFHDDWNSGGALAFARTAAAHARRRRRTRTVVLSGGTIAAALAVVFLTWSRSSSGRKDSDPHATAAPTAASRSYEIISDEELLAQIRDRPLLVVQKENGAREFVMLENQ